MHTQKRLLGFMLRIGSALAIFIMASPAISASIEWMWTSPGALIWTSPQMVWYAFEKHCLFRNPANALQGVQREK